VIAGVSLRRSVRSTETDLAQVDAYNRGAINCAIERYHAEHREWPSEDLAELDGPPYFPDGLPRDPVSGEPYAMDDQTHRVE